LAEIDLARHFRGAGGQFSAHNLTGKNPNPALDSNYDLRWTSNLVLHADVKWFADWLVTPGVNLLVGQTKLIGQDLTHPVVILVPHREWAMAFVIQAALEVVELQEAAVNDTEDPRWHIEHVGQTTLVTWLPAAGNRMITGISVDLSQNLPAGQKSVQVRESGIPQTGQRGAIRENIRKAAEQLPQNPGENDLCCPIIGSSLETDAADVEEVLSGDDEHPGIFHPASEEEGFDNIDAVIAFSLNFEQVQGQAGSVLVRRSAQFFSPQGALSAAQLAFLNAVVTAYATNTVLNAP
jgi:hypothetical protein